MRLEAVIVCDAADIRENVVSLLGGGFSWMTAANGQAAVTVVGVFIHEDGDPEAAAITATANDQHGTECGSTAMLYTVHDADSPGPRRRVFTFLLTFAVSEPGEFAVAVSVDGSSTTLPLIVR